FALLGIFSFNHYGMVGGIILMIGHGFISAGLFVCIGILYTRYGTRDLKYYGGLSLYMPRFSAYIFLFLLANCAFPGTVNFSGEFLCYFGLFILNHENIFLILIILSSTIIIT